MYQINKQFNLKTIFKNYKLESILFGLWSLKEKLQPIQVACTTTIAIEFCSPGSYDDSISHIAEEKLLKLVRKATQFCLEDNTICKDSSVNKIFYTLFSLMANQFNLISNYNYDFARALLLYKIIPEEIGTKKNKLDLPSLFEKDKGYSIEDYLRVCFIASAAINGSGRFNDNYFIGVESITDSIKFDTMNKILSELSVSAIHYRRERRRINLTNSFKYHPLFMYPIIRPWSKIPIHSKQKRYLSPLPNLIGHKAHFGLYHHFLTKYHTKFTSFFGKEIFECYVEKTLNSCRFDENLFDEDDIKEKYKIPEGVKIPDFLFINGNNGIIVECKAAVLPLGIYTSGNVKDFKSTVEKIYIGVNQTANFETYALEKSLFHVTKWMRLVITYEMLWGMSSDILSDILITDFKKENEAKKFKEEYKGVLILSISQLDDIQQFVTKNCSLLSILNEVSNKNNFLDVIRKLSAETGRTFADSHLFKYTEEITDNLLH